MQVGDRSLLKGLAFEDTLTADDPVLRLTHFVRSQQVPEDDALAAIRQGFHLGEILFGYYFETFANEIDLPFIHAHCTAEMVLNYD